MEDVQVLSLVGGLKEEGFGMVLLFLKKIAEAENEKISFSKETMDSPYLGLLGVVHHIDKELARRIGGG